MSTDPAQPPTTRSADVAGWHSQDAGDVAVELEVDPAVGLSEAEAARRLDERGPNALRETPPVPLWRKVVGLLVEPMTLVLILAAVVSAVVSRELETPIVILVVVVVNAVLNLAQERRAQHSLQALQDLTVVRARVRRDGRLQVVDAADLVPGDVVLLEAGDVVPADGRLVETAGMEVQEAALTGESSPVTKRAEAKAARDAGLGDRPGTAYMTTAVTRGRGVLVVCATGPRTEIGRVADLLESAGQETTPLQRQIAGLARTLSIIAGVVVGVVFLAGLARGAPLEELGLSAVALAVATIPEGLTAVVAFTLAMGANRLARRGAILKDLSSVETLGATRHVATDKTGTLTLNEMTARELYVDLRGFQVSGHGYAADGEISAEGPEPAPDLREALLAMALASDAVVDDAVLVGDPTEGALVVLAAKGGLDVAAARRDVPRAAEVPFDSDRKYMATVHAVDAVDPASPTARWAAGSEDGWDGPGAARMYVKGAPDVLLARSREVDAPGGARALDDRLREEVGRVVDDLGERGLRVLAVAARGLDDDELARARESSPAELDQAVQGLTFLGCVGIVDPPRPEARDAIADAHRAGISVHMITGDHVVTASAIARDLGLEGEALSGADLDRLDDQELTARAQHVAVLARVSPEHKIRMVDALRADGSVVAMTGDGVNDAPALKQADIGIAMGITGTEVSKGAARMILTDDNFATIIAAVREGRGIYANVVKFVRFQIATAWGFVLVFLGAASFGIASGAPFTPLQVLWVNIIMDGPPAMTLGFDRPDEGVMRRPPRRVGEPILTRTRMARIMLAAVVMAVGTLGVLLLGPDEAVAGEPTVTGTLAFTTFVLFQVFNLLNVRDATKSVFSRYTATNARLWAALVVIVVLQVAVVHLEAGRGPFDTTDLTLAQWGIAVAVASSVLWVEELRKLVLRTRTRARGRSSGPQS
ncbi:cation-translocating P-type ATPase [Nocardioides campestrisoli]|uniref:cation-translocating P-type ATPase n=1 Tax=Nocardioides campestrisoli TaxID=2736757 RepID=UPI00163DCD41|nr:cation-transporting P-type ATPase [Nocardioides campestrisoli]